MGSETFISPNHPFGGFSFFYGYLFITNLFTALVKRASRETTAINLAIVKQTRECDSRAGENSRQTRRNRRLERRKS